LIKFVINLLVEFCKLGIIQQLLLVFSDTSQFSCSATYVATNPATNLSAKPHWLQLPSRTAKELILTQQMHSTLTANGHHDQITIALEIRKMRKHGSQSGCRLLALLSAVGDPI